MKSLFSILFSLLIGIPSFATINASPSMVMFGSVKVSEFGYNTRTIYVSNQSDKAVNVYVSGYCPSDFRVTNNCHYLSPYGSCNINVNFMPTRVGNHNCNINVRDDQGSTAFVSVSGTGVKN